MPFRTLFTHIPGAIFRRRLFRFLNHPALRRRGPALLRRLGLYPFARTLYWRFFSADGRTGGRSPFDSFSTDASTLTPRTRQVLAALKAATDHARKASR